MRMPTCRGRITPVHWPENPPRRAHLSSAKATASATPALVLTASCGFHSFGTQNGLRSHASRQYHDASYELHGCGNEHCENCTQKPLPRNQPIASCEKAQVSQNVQHDL